MVVRSVCIRDVGVRFSQGPPKRLFKIESSFLFGFDDKVNFHYNLGAIEDILSPNRETKCYFLNQKVTLAWISGLPI